MIVSSENEMMRLGADLATKLSLGDVVLLKGALGVGKSVLARALVRAWMEDAQAEVPSPSFTLVQNYEGARGALHHFDLYRLASEDELIELGVPEIFQNAVSVIEWPERLVDYRPENAIEIEIIDQGDSQRLLRLKKAGQVWNI